MTEKPDGTWWKYQKPTRKPPNGGDTLCVREIRLGTLTGSSSVTSSSPVIESLGLFWGRRSADPTHPTLDRFDS